MTSLVQMIEQPSNQGMNDTLSIEVTELSPDVRLVQITMSVNGQEYYISSNAVQTSPKGAEIAVELLQLLFRQPDLGGST